MRAIVCTAFGTEGNLALEDRPTPEPGPGRVRVVVKAAGASFVDGLQAAGKYQFAAQPPYVPGGEAAGLVDAVGDGVHEWAVGDRVVASIGKGAFADHIIATPQQLVRLPDGIDFTIGATFMQVYGTAWFAFKKRTVVRPGEVVLVTGAGGGVGLAAIDVARSMGARVIAVASSEEKRALAIAMGAESAIDPLTEDVKTRARELTDGAGVDVVYDVVGGDVSEPAMRALKFDGRFLVIGFPGGIARLPLNLVLLNNRTVVGVEWGGWVPRNLDENRAMIADIVSAIESGELHPVAPFERPLEDASAVLSELLNRRALGKIVLIP
jgi:NADPH2:quinone reductase